MSFARWAPLVFMTAVILVPECAEARAVRLRTAKPVPHTLSKAPTSSDTATEQSRNPAAIVKDFDSWLDAVDQSGQVSGLAVAVIKDDKILLQRGIGYANAQTGEPVTPDTVFRLASLSKAFASALAAVMIDEGLMAWDTRISGVLPTFQLADVDAGQKLTVRDILSQRAGLPHNTYDRLLEADEPYPVLVEKLKEVPMACAVGDCYGYQNITFSLIGDITYAVSGDFFYHQVEKRLFHPLGMTTATYGRDALESSPSWARPHSHRGKAWVAYEPKESYYHVPPAAGVNASIKDMSQWLIAQMGGRTNVLPQSVLDQLHAPQVTTPTEGHASPWRRSRVRDASYALGWRVYDYAGETLLFHAGAVQGYRATIGFFPKYRFGAVVLWNCECSLPSGLLPMLLDRYIGMPPVDWAGIETLRSGRIAAGGGE
jgi:beta-lactamase class C